jgi:ATP-dependent DNA helicase PIF1
MPIPNIFYANLLQNKFILDELNYDVAEHAKENKKLVVSLTNEEKEVYEQFVSEVLNQIGGPFFLYGYGNTGKTFI